MKCKLSGDRVRELRKSMGLTVEELASVLQVSAITFYRWQGCDRKPACMVGLPATIFNTLHGMKEADRRVTGELVKLAIVERGSLGALHVLLGEMLYGDHEP